MEYRILDHLDEALDHNTLCASADVNIGVIELTTEMILSEESHRGTKRIL